MMKNGNLFRTFSYFVLKIGQGDYIGYHSILSYTDTKQYQITAIGFSTGNMADADWQIAKFSGILPMNFGTFFWNILKVRIQGGAPSSRGSQPII